VTLCAVPAFQIRLPGVGGVATGSGGESDGTPSFSDHNGPILDHAQLQLIVWGAAWAGARPPSADDVTGAVRAILASTFTSALAQYRGIVPATVHGTSLVTDSDPPNLFSNDQVAGFLKGMMQAGRLPEPDQVPQLVYCVFLPPGVNHDDQSVIGEHSYFWYWDLEPPFDFDVGKAYYAWVTNDGTLETVTTVFSHELVEVLTDPEGSGITGSPCTASGWCEIGDVCEASTGTVNGIAVQAYWSEQARACVVPGSA
jgi:hypothetical protein